MGFLSFSPFVLFRLSVKDSILGSVFKALNDGLHEGMLVSICAPDIDDGSYLEIDVANFVPGVVTKSGEHITKDSHVMFAKPHFCGAEIPADEVLVEQLLHVMDETDGCIVFDVNDELVLEPDVAKHIRLNARRVNPFEGIIFPFPGHD